MQGVDVSYSIHPFFFAWKWRESVAKIIFKDGKF
jgi:hypothetical protein